MIHSCCLNKELKIELFSFLSEEELHLFDTNLYCASYKKGDLIYKFGSPLTHVVFLTDGYTLVYREATINKKFILSVTKPVNFLSGPGIFYEGINHYSVKAISDCKLCFIDKNTFLKVFYSNNKFAECFMREFGFRSVRTMNNFIDITHMNMEGRIAKLILFLSNTIYQKDSYDFLISRQDIADYCAITKESAVRILKSFENDNIIKLDNNCIEIIDKKRLEFFVSMYKPKDEVFV
jgi:CRP-like cAMP-binding protein